MSDGSSGQRMWVDCARVAVAAFVVPQLSLLLWWTHLAVHFVGWVNVEYLLLLCVALLFPSWWMIAVLVVELLLDVMQSLANLYYFSPMEAVHAARYLLLMPVWRLAGYGLLLVVYVACCAVVLRWALGGKRKPRAKQMAAVLLAVVPLTLAADMVTGRARTLPMLHRFAKQIDAQTPRVTRWPVMSSVRSYAASEYWFGGKVEVRAMASALSGAMTDVRAESRPDVVLVMVESWGLGTDERMNAALTATYQDAGVQQRYEVRRGTVGFLGATTRGESRELCGDSSGNSSVSEPASYFARCWPMRFAESGYHTLAVHGFSAAMFDRGDWYGRLGFERSALLPELERDGVGLCDGTFRGACDADVARWIGGRLTDRRDGRPMFVHWMTLNSHLPLPAVDVGALPSECGPLGIAQDAVVCSWFARVLTVQEGVAQMATMPGLRPTVFVVVGDHAPPFMSASARERFARGVVPYVVLMPRAERK